MAYSSIVISSGHGKYVRGACGIIDEVDEARSVTERVANDLRMRGVDVLTFHDDVSGSQSENLHRITDFHNAHPRDLDISIHFNAFEQVDKPMGVEVLYITQGALAGEVSAAIACAGGFLNRGAKKRTDLHFLMRATWRQSCWRCASSIARRIASPIVIISKRSAWPSPTRLAASPQRIWSKRRSRRSRS